MSLAVLCVFQNGMSPELQDAKQVQAKLQAQVQHYKEVLADTVSTASGAPFTNMDK